MPRCTFPFEARILTRRVRALCLLVAWSFAACSDRGDDKDTQSIGDENAKIQELRTAEDAPLEVPLLGPGPFEILNSGKHGALTLSERGATYQPDTDYHGVDEVSYASNGDEVRVRVTIEPQNDAPVVRAKSIVATSDAVTTFEVDVSDVDGDDVTLDVVVDPSHGRLFGNGKVWMYEPEPFYIGEDRFSFSASDGVLASLPSTFVVEVRADRAPYLPDRFVSTGYEQAVEIDLTGYDPEGQPLEYEILEGPSNGTLSGEPPIVTYTPNARFSGLDVLRVQVADGQTKVEARVSIEVGYAPGALPWFVPLDPVSLNEDDASALALPAFAKDGSSPISYEILAGPSHGTLTGQFPAAIYTPTRDYFGQDRVEVRISSSYGSLETVLEISVLPINDAPVLMVQDAEASPGESVALRIRAQDVDDALLTYEVASAPSVGMVEGVGPDFSYRAPLDFTGEATLMLRVLDPMGAQASGKIVIRAK